MKKLGRRMIVLMATAFATLVVSVTAAVAYPLPDPPAGDNWKSYASWWQVQQAEKQQSKHGKLLRHHRVKR